MYFFTSLITSRLMFFALIRHYCVLRHLGGKFYFGCLQEVMSGIPYLHRKVHYSKTTSTNNFEIIPQEFFAKCNFFI